MAEEVEMDQQVYDDLIAQGKSERIARAKAKAAAVRARKAAEGPAAGDEAAAAGAAGDTGAQPKAAAAAVGGGDGPSGAGRVATQARPGAAGGVLTPEERQARVAAALATKGNGGTATNGPTRYLPQEHTHRLLAMVPPSGIQQIRGKQEDKVYTWPHLLGAEMLSLLVMTAFLVVVSALVQAPLLDLANPNVTPNPSKAPWYFMGLQELLRYFHPMIAGVTIPTVGILIGMAVPYIDKNPSVRPENRKFAIVAFTIALIFNAVLVTVGSFFRGPGFNWVWPWIDGMWFQL